MPFRWSQVRYDDPDVAGLLALLSVEMNLLYDRPPDEAPPGVPVDPSRLALTVLGESDGVPMATASPRRLGEALELKRMYVAPDARGDGLGARLLERMEAEAARLGARRLVLHTGERQVAAVTLYRTRGYQPVPALPGYDDVPGSLFLGRTVVLAPAVLRAARDMNMTLAM